MKTLIVILVLFSTQTLADLTGKNLLCKPFQGINTFLLYDYSLEQQVTAQTAELTYVGISFTSLEDIEYHQLFEDKYEILNLVYVETDTTITFNKKIEPCTDCSLNDMQPNGSIDRQYLSMTVTLPNNFVGQIMNCEIFDFKEDLLKKIDNLFNLKKKHYEDIRNLKLKKNKI